MNTFSLFYLKNQFNTESRKLGNNTARNMEVMQTVAASSGPRMEENRRNIGHVANEYTLVFDPDQHKLLCRGNKVVAMGFSRVWDCP